MNIPDEAVQAMPERIYAMPKSDTKHCVVAFDEASLDYHIEYVRADLAAPSPRAQALEEAERLDAATAALISLTEAGIPTDVQELLIVGDPSRGIAPGSLSKAIATVIRALSSQPVAATRPTGGSNHGE